MVYRVNSMLRVYREETFSLSKYGGGVKLLGEGQTPEVFRFIFSNYKKLYALVIPKDGGNSFIKELISLENKERLLTGMDFEAGHYVLSTWQKGEQLRAYRISAGEEIKRYEFPVKNKNSELWELHKKDINRIEYGNWTPIHQLASPYKMYFPSSGHILLTTEGNDNVSCFSNIYEIDMQTLHLEIKRLFHAGGGISERQASYSQTNSAIFQDKAFLARVNKSAFALSIQNSKNGKELVRLDFNKDDAAIPFPASPVYRLRKTSGLFSAADEDQLTRVGQVLRNFSRSNLCVGVFPASRNLEIIIAGYAYRPGSGFVIPDPGSGLPVGRVTPEQEKVSFFKILLDKETLEPMDQGPGPSSLPDEFYFYTLQIACFEKIEYPQYFKIGEKLCFGYLQNGNYNILVQP